MQKYVCNVCGYVYDPETGDPSNGVAPGTPFEDIPGDWTAPSAASAKMSSRRSNKAEVIGNR